MESFEIRRDQTGIDEIFTGCDNSHRTVDTRIGQGRGFGVRTNQSRRTCNKLDDRLQLHTTSTDNPRELPAEPAAILIITRTRGEPPCWAGQVRCRDGIIVNHLRVHLMGGQAGPQHQQAEQ